MVRGVAVTKYMRKPSSALLTLRNEHRYIRKWKPRDRQVFCAACSNHVASCFERQKKYCAHSSMQKDSFSSLESRRRDNDSALNGSSLVFLGCFLGLLSSSIDNKTDRSEPIRSHFFFSKRSFTNRNTDVCGINDFDLDVKDASSINHKDKEEQNQDILASSPTVRKLRRPTIFGSSILDLVDDHKNTNDADLSDIPLKSSERDDHCPICRKYSKGPCGDTFQEWLKCTDKYEGKINKVTGEDMHLSKCEDLATRLATCLETHEMFYKSQQTTDGVDSAHSTDDSSLKRQWEIIINDLETERGKAAEPFPSRNMSPRMEVNPNETMGLAVFAPSHRKPGSDGDYVDHELIVAYIKDNNGNILAAATAADMEDQFDLFDGYALSYDLTTHDQETLRSVTAFAIYDEPNVSFQPIYSKKMMLRK